MGKGGIERTKVGLSESQREESAPTSKGKTGGSKQPGSKEIENRERDVADVRRLPATASVTPKAPVTTQTAIAGAPGRPHYTDPQAEMAFRLQNKILKSATLTSAIVTEASQAVKPTAQPMPPEIRFVGARPDGLFDVVVDVYRLDKRNNSQVADKHLVIVDAAGHVVHRPLVHLSDLSRIAGELTLEARKLASASSAHISPRDVSNTTAKMRQLVDQLRAFVATDPKLAKHELERAEDLVRGIARSMSGAAGGNEVLRERDAAKTEYPFVRQIALVANNALAEISQLKKAAAAATSGPPRQR